MCHGKSHGGVCESGKYTIDCRGNWMWRGTENAVTGITSKDDESKLRGTRGVLYLLEEAGTFSRLLNLYSVLRPSVEDGNEVWGTIFAYGTAGDSESDFSGMQELMYNPQGYNMLALPNVYNLEILEKIVLNTFSREKRYILSSIFSSL